MKGMIGRLCVGVALSALAAGPSFAQEVPPASDTSGTADPSVAAGTQQAQNEIVVTGLRRSEQAAIDIKRNAVNIVDSIASEDIGKLPESNVAESLQRITGVTIDRSHGDGNFISVRGLGPQFNIVTLNGRTLATENVGREFSFDELPSELIAGADVYKSPTAQLNGASIGATVNIRTVRPLDLKPFTFALTAQAQDQDLGNSWGPALSGVASWHNSDDTFGVAVVASYEDRKIRTDEFDIGAGWVTHSNDDSYYAGRVGPGVAPFTNITMPSNMSPTYDFTSKKRFGANGTVQWKPTDTLLFTLDGFYTKLNEVDNVAQIAYDFSGGTLVDQVVQGGSAVYQRFTGGTVDEIVSRTPQHNTTYLIGGNLQWHKGDVRLTADLSRSQATRKGNDESYFSTIRRTGMDLSWDSRTGSPIFDMAWSNPNYPNAATDVNHVGAHYEADGGSNIKDQTLEAKLDGVWDPGTGLVVSFGAARENRKKTNSTIQQPVDSQCAFCGGGVFVPMPSSLFHTTPDDWFSGYGGNIPRQWITYDPRQFVQALEGFQSSDPNFVGYEAPVFNPAASSVVNEHVNIGYLMFDYKTDFAGMPLAINTGLRFEDTSFTSKGAAQTILSAVPNGGGQNIITLSPIVPFGFSGHYDDFLPSMNVRLDLTSKLIARFSASRVMTRPTLTDLSPAQSILTNPGNEQIVRGNPDLKPFRASQVETGLEWYFDRTSLLSLALFYKSIDSFVAQTTTPQQVDQVTFQVTEPTNGKGATVKGLELNYRQAFTRLPGFLSGLGFQGSFTLVGSNAHYANQVSGTSYGLEGLSKYSYSLVGYYEKYGIQARLAYTWRSKYLETANGRNGLPLYYASYGQLDASLSYDINKHFSVMASAVNLTDEREFTYSTIAAQTFSYGDTGRRFTFGARMRF